ncbi:MULTISPECIES: 50S ribosomal protein L25/general stress protein Ctc [Mammaliicoccus]|jgi:large subunit ribosomal protein L25|uniref:Large ribosomal subunit protein bL25 n=1 Tax=Mammaliicoccus lentus TaxID=42858 RepID=A0ABS6GYJ8_MAMLE|nr:MULTISPECIES: 50S ribosomal protein L25/general stress protein Ctc [Mammaliicoccus]MBF0750233.1 50S ribosomal protein L25/general stress protein Ctc [Mammaliicoccus lentus]MBF0795692.1 50S ribosomal protein L25/general stress protein Ctc [Mammaliicoccus lentus]MBF0841311.1 50S ribosomal protein L25/general stress protein Ctc [Mammaliicoccus lentus]MBU6114529.1 50S ribosomal protein L25/general stress protein Ctc [Mammaliicoccus lentus]MBW0763579.1 50S ribosomal protein L25/general stress pr
MASLKSVIRQGKQTRSSLRKLRASGIIPAVVYGYGAKNTSVKVDEVEFIKTIREVGRNGVIELGVGSKSIKVMVSDYQYDSLKNQITHVDFLAINMKQELTVDVPVVLVGEAVGASEGGVVQQPLFDLQVTTTPDAIPEHIEVDISELAIGDSYLVGDLDATDKYAIENDKEEAVVTVVPPTEEPAEDAEETAAEDADAVSQEAEKEEKEEE